MGVCSPLLFVIKEQPSVLEDHTGGQGVLSFCYVGAQNLHKDVYCSNTHNKLDVTGCRHI